MATIVKCSEDVIDKIPSVMEHIYKVFGTKTIIVYAVLSDNNIGFIARDIYNFLYIKNEQNGYSVTPFQIKEDGTVGMIKLDDNHFFFGNGDTYMVDKDKIEHGLGIRALKETDEDEYDGFVYYTQYNPANDTLCDINYQQMYREIEGRTPIYGYHTKKIDVLSIDEKYSKRGNKHAGILSRHSKYFSRYEFDSDQIGYKLVAIKDYGIFDVITQGAYNLQKEDSIIRYVKAFYSRKDGSFVDIWPLSSHVDTETLKSLISSYGFRTEIPRELLEVYNRDNRLVLEIQDLASQIKELGKCDDEEMCMILELVPEKDDETKSEQS